MSYHERYQLTHATVWLNALLTSYPEHDMGLLYVERFCESCDILLSEGLIKDYKIWPKKSYMDEMGVDATIDLGNRLVDFQITSSLSEAKKHKRTNEDHPERGKIRIIYVREGNKPVLKSIESLQKEIIRKAYMDLK